MNHILDDTGWTDGRQDKYRTITEIGPSTGRTHSKLRTKVRINSYDFQSYAVTEVWTENGWKEVASASTSEFSDLNLYAPTVLVDALVPLNRVRDLAWLTIGDVPAPRAITND